MAYVFGLKRFGGLYRSSTPATKPVDIFPDGKGVFQMISSGRPILYLLGVRVEEVDLKPWGLADGKRLTQVEQSELWARFPESCRRQFLFGDEYD
jgi:hypothetical protein